MDKTEKRIDISGSSLVALKAELLTKQSQVSQQKLLIPSNVIKRQAVKKAAVKQNPGVEARAVKDKEQNEHEVQSYEKARTILEQKAKLYDKLTQEALKSDEDEDEPRFLVNFQRKQVEDVLEKARLRKEAEENKVEIPANNPDEEWVDFVDCLGRSRRCLRKDLPGLIKQEEELQRDGSAPSVHSDLLSEDMRRELQRQQWEKEEEESRRKGTRHYQDVLFEEARAHGVGYFAFSKDELERAEQQTKLKELRQQTEDIRKRKAEQEKKRNAELKERLKKVRDRKRLKMGLPILEKDDTDKEQVEDPGEETATVPVEPLLTEREPTLDVTQVRPWDMGKEGVPKTAVMSQGNWVKKRREERPQEFAPPALYSQDTKQKRPSSSLCVQQENQPMPSISVQEIPLPSTNVEPVTNAAPAKLTSDAITQNLAFLRQQTEGDKKNESKYDPKPSSARKPDVRRGKLPDKRGSQLNLGFDVSAVKDEHRGDEGYRHEPRKGVEIAPPASMDYFANTQAKHRAPVKKFNLSDSIAMGKKLQELASSTRDKGKQKSSGAAKAILGMDIDFTDSDSG